ncbi:MAG TPA: metallophosphoesterase family protein [Bryobacteraceae bacterium]|nr:metallophosphoesterase family protein [Bryobacteraceae bacterium]
MRVGVVSDIHGNVRALQAVIADLRQAAPDLVLNLGDHVSGPLEARETADLLMTAGSHWTHIRGNHDRELVETPLAQMGMSDAMAAGQLSPKHFDWLRALPPIAVVDSIRLVHGTERSDLEYLLESVAPPHMHVAPAAQIEERLARTDEVTICCGHSHVPRCINLGGRLLLNPGSVGLPAYNARDHVSETGGTLARYALIDRDRASVSVTFRAVPYDNAAAVALAAKAGRRDWECALLTGYALR